ncbi:MULTISPECIES: hypothetical protein [Bradyrhizobium]|uniref:hypothetical protein n=1 Tax=Bradyrhizobium TaxID=374 RepID=UPI0012D33EF2|nr:MULTISPECIES: hypothetical protein [Bradyrhizobium]MTV19115.1 hypothetical protein [Bradyrhizobium sp. BR2003]
MQKMAEEGNDCDHPDQRQDKRHRERDVRHAQHCDTASRPLTWAMIDESQKGRRNSECIAEGFFPYGADVATFVIEIEIATAVAWPPNKRDGCGYSGQSQQSPVQQDLITSFRWQRGYLWHTPPS